MYNIRKLFDNKAGHPMATAAAARKILADTAKSTPLAALDEIANWAANVGDFDGYTCDTRFEVVAEIDLTGRNRAEAVRAEFMKHIHKRDSEQRKLFEALYSYWMSLSGGYGRCVRDYQRGEPGAQRFRQDLPLALVRAIRAAAMAEKTRQMRYVSVSADTWQSLYKLLECGETLGIDTEVVAAYPREWHTTPRAELLRLMGLSLASLHELPPEQVDLAGRMVDRFAISFAWSREPAPACNFVVDLSRPADPWQRKDDESPGASKRYFGGGPALAKMQEIEDTASNNRLSEDSCYGREYSQAQIVTVVKHLRNYLGPKPPERRLPKASAGAPVSVIRGFRAIYQRAAPVQLGSMMTVGDDLNAVQRGASAMQLAPEAVDAVPEVWQSRDRSEWGVGADVPAGMGEWAQPGVLCGIREHDDGPWSIGIIRRMDVDKAERLHCGFWIVSKKPVAVALRVVRMDPRVDAIWEQTSAGFDYRHLRGIILPDALKVDGNPVILLERQNVRMGEICEVMLGVHSRQIELLDMIEERTDYMRVTFAWKAKVLQAPANLRPHAARNVSRVEAGAMRA